MIPESTLPRLMKIDLLIYQLPKCIRIIQSGKSVKSSARMCRSEATVLLAALTAGTYFYN